MKIIDIALHNACNYSCDYCIAKSYKVSGDGHWFNNVVPSHSLNPVILEDWIKSNVSPNDTVLSFAGGEPLIFPALRYLLQDLYGYTRVIVTNGKFVPNFLRLFPAARNDAKLFWKVSFHPTMARVKDFILLLSELPRERTLLNYVVHPARVAVKSDKCECVAREHIAALEASGYKVNLNPFMGEFDGREFAKVDKVYEGFNIFDTPAEMVRMFFIEPNGNFKICYNEVIGNIYKDAALPLERYERLTCATPEGITTCDCFQAIRKLVG